MAQFEKDLARGYIEYYSKPLIVGGNANQAKADEFIYADDTAKTILLKEYALMVLVREQEKLALLQSDITTLNGKIIELRNYING